jgi:hypothetical protein
MRHAAAPPAAHCGSGSQHADADANTAEEEAAEGRFRIIPSAVKNSSSSEDDGKIEHGKKIAHVSESSSSSEDDGAGGQGKRTGHRLRERRQRGGARWTDTWFIVSAEQQKQQQQAQQQQQKEHSAHGQAGKQIENGAQQVPESQLEKERQEGLVLLGTAATAAAAGTPFATATREQRTQRRASAASSDLQQEQQQLQPCPEQQKKQTRSRHSRKEAQEGTVDREEVDGAPMIESYDKVCLWKRPSSTFTMLPNNRLGSLIQNSSAIPHRAW